MTLPEYPTGCIWACFRESVHGRQPASGEQVQDITIPLFRDFSRVRIYIASIAPFEQIIYNYKRIAF